MSKPELDLKLYLVVGRENVIHKTAQGVLHVVNEAILGVVTTIQFHDKTASDSELLDFASSISETIQNVARTGRRVGFLINDRVDIALEARNAGLLDGVHLGQRDTNPVDARKLLGDDAVIGLTCGKK
jgi:thiamine-phosphate diphosphorylase